MPPQVRNVRGWLQPIMRSAAKTNYPWTKLYDELKLVEPVYRKAEFGHDYRTYISAYEKGAKLRYIRYDYKPSRKLFSEARVSMRKAFKYNVETTFIDRATGGEVSKRSSFVTSDRQLTRGEIESLAADRISEIAEDYDSDVKAILTEAWHREGDYWD